MEPDFNDESWTRGIPWYASDEQRGGSSREAAARLRRAHYQQRMSDVIAEPDDGKRAVKFYRAVQETLNECRGLPLDTPMTDEDQEWLSQTLREVEQEFSTANTDKREVRMSVNEGRSIDVNAPYAEHVGRGQSGPKPAFDRPMPREASFADLLGVPESQRDLSLGKYLRGVITGDWRGAEREYEHRAMGEGTPTGGGNLVPQIYSSQVIDLARNQCQVVNAGAQIVPMSAPTVILPKWTSDPVPAFRQEAASIAQTDATVGQVVLRAKSLAGYTTISREMVEDTDLSDLLANAYGKAVAIAWDSAALFGNGTAPNPLGITNDPSVTDKASLGTNGVSFTYDHLIDAVGGVRGRNENVTAALMAPRSYQSLGKLKDSQGRYLNRPDYLSDVRILQTNQIPVNQTAGTSSNASTLVTGDFSQCLIGVRTSFGIDVFNQPMATTGQLLMVSWMRLDVAVARGTAFAVRTGLLP